MPSKNQVLTQQPRDAVELGLDVFRDRWSFLILREGFYGVRRYGQMQRDLGIARNVLAERLKQLVADGLFERVRYRTDPDWYEYRLTERALELYPMIVGLMRWAEKHLAEDREVIAPELIHRACGARADPYLACSHCHQPLSARDIVPKPRGAAAGKDARPTPPSKTAKA